MRRIFHYILVLGLFALSILCLIFYNGWIPFFIALAIFFGGRLISRKLFDVSPLMFKLLIGFIVIVVLSLTASVTSFMKSETNYAYASETNLEEPMLVLESGTWKPLEEVTAIDHEDVYTSDKVSVKTIYIKRNHQSTTGKIKNVFRKEEIRIFKFSPDHDFYLVANPDDGFSPLSINEAKQRKPSHFLINASLFDPQNNPLGEVLYLGKPYQRAFTSENCGGFQVIDGVPHVGNQSRFKNINGSVLYACQGTPYSIKEGKIIYNETNDSANKEHMYRNLVGETEDGSIVFIASNRGALMSVMEITKVAQLFKVKYATLLDGGSSLAYSFNHSGFNDEFCAFNTTIDAGRATDKYFMNRWKLNFLTRSPVFIGVNIKE